MFGVLGVCMTAWLACHIQGGRPARGRARDRLPVVVVFSLGQCALWSHAGRVVVEVVGP